jgi:tetratricopeptide (TPR) repeat protein
METIQEGLMKGTSMLGEDDVKFALLVQQIKMEGENIAQGKYKAKKYDEAADYFYKTGFLKTMIFKAKDTASFMNACIAAAKSKNTSKIIEYNKKMIDFKVASPYNYDNLFNANLSKGDTSAAMSILAKGRTAFPNDMSLLNSETNMFLARGKQAEALTNLKTSIEKDPKNAVLYLVTGNIYDNMANPKDKATGKDLDKPKEFDEYFKTAETNYLKAIELSAENKDLQYNSLYNLGAMYNNYGGYLQNKKVEGKITDLQKLQKEQDAKSQEFYKKAIPYLEKALGLKPDDKATMVALRKLYLMTGDEVKGKEMNEKIKGGK